MTPIIRFRTLSLLFLVSVAGSLPAQTIQTISPGSVPAGSPNFALTVNGVDFSSDAIVEVNGEPLLTIAYGSTTLKALVFSEDVAKAGTRTVVVLNDSGAVAHYSNTVTLTVTGSGTPPPPPPPPPTPPPAPKGVVSIAITSPVQNQQVCSPVTLIASATTTNSQAEIAGWKVYTPSGLALWNSSAPTSSIDPKITLSPGTETLEIEAWDSSGAQAHTNVAFDITTAAPPCGGNASGVVTSWQGCMESVNGTNRQAIDFTLTEAATLPFNATLYFGANCSPSNWADQFGFGQDISFGGFSYIFWFRDFPNQPNTSAIWTVGKQSSGCINYGAVPAC
jgi:hypothetical protein